jgi:N4-(beta-N-acetylglucosaminyl)-L-asparaginase
MRRTDHSLLVGEGASSFAAMLGFKQEDLVTPAAREAWLTWKATLSNRDAWLSPNEIASDFGRAKWAGREEGSSETEAGAPAPNQSGGAPKVPFTFGTIYLGGLDAAGDLCAVTSTSGLSYKIPGRVGDTPVVGGGIYVDNAVGTAGATGRGEAVLQSCGGFYAVTRMEAGDTPAQACLASLKRIVDRTREPRLLDSKGRPTFNVTMYAVRKDGLVGAASIHEGYEYVCFEGSRVDIKRAEFLFAK